MASGDHDRADSSCLWGGAARGRAEAGPDGLCRLLQLRQETLQGHRLFDRCLRVADREGGENPAVVGREHRHGDGILVGHPACPLRSGVGFAADVRQLLAQRRSVSCRQIVRVVGMGKDIQQGLTLLSATEGQIDQAGGRTDQADAPAGGGNGLMASGLSMSVLSRNNMPEPEMVAMAMGQTSSSPSSAMMGLAQSTSQLSSS